MFERKPFLSWFEDFCKGLSKQSVANNLGTLEAIDFINLIGLPRKVKHVPKLALNVDNFPVVKSDINFELTFLSPTLNTALCL